MQDEVWFAAASSVVGSSHLNRATPCQDRHGWKLLPGGVFIAVVSDGAGSRPRSGEGAELVVQTALAGLETLAGTAPSTDIGWSTAMRELFVDIWEALSDFADAELTDISEFNATASCIIVTPDVCVLGQIGDGAIVLDLDPTGLFLPIPPENGEYANSTYFVNRLASHKEHVHIRVLHESIRGIGLITDGLGDYVLERQNQSVVAREAFWRQFFDRMDAAVGAEDQSPKIKGLLASSKIQDTFTDDLTLILAVPVTGVFALAGIDESHQQPAELTTASRQNPNESGPDAPLECALLEELVERDPSLREGDSPGKPEHLDTEDESIALPRLDLKGAWIAHEDAPEVNKGYEPNEDEHSADDSTSEQIVQSTQPSVSSDELFAPGETPAGDEEGSERADRLNLQPAITDSDADAAEDSPPQEPVAKGEAVGNAANRHETPAFPTELYLEDLEMGSPLGRGGTASIHELSGFEGYVKKLFYQSIPPEQASKIQWMVANPPSSAAQQFLTWPLAAVRNDQDQLVGYVMRRLPPKTVPLSTILVQNKATIYKTLEREPLTLRDMHIIAWNLAATVHSCHREGYVLVDLNERDVYVSSKGHVRLIDNDSFQINDSLGTFYSSHGYAKPENHSPELAASIKAGEVAPSHDDFVLAILIFRLLMDNVHPFRGSTDLADADGPPDETRLLKEGRYPYDVNRSDAQIRPHKLAPPLARLHNEIVTGFQRTFTVGISEPHRRVTAGEWLDILQKATSALDRCKRGHWYSTDRNCCLAKGANGLYCGATLGSLFQPVPVADVDPATGELLRKQPSSSSVDTLTVSPASTWPSESSTSQRSGSEPVPVNRSSALLTWESVSMSDLSNSEETMAQEVLPMSSTTETSSSAGRLWRKITKRS